MDMLQSFFQSVPYFVILIGLLVFIHEAGHFAFAKLFKVKVHVFSLGFGPKIFGYQKGETFYKVSALPLGGYVKMLGEDPTEQIGPEDKGRAFSDKPPWQRFLIIVGGPVMNIIFPLFLHFGVGLTFTEVVPAEVGFVLEGMPAWNAGLRPGDVITSVDGKPVDTFNDLVDYVSPGAGKKMTVAVLRDGQTQSFDLIPKPVEVPIVLDEMETIGRIGVAPSYLSTLVGVSDAKSPVASAGLQTFDLVEAVDGKKVARLIELEKQLVAKAGSSATLTVKRMKADAQPPFQPFDDQFEKASKQIVINVPADTRSLADIGIESSTSFVAHVTKGGVAEAIGLKRGDKLVGLNGKPSNLSLIIEAFNRDPKKSHRLAWIRGGERFEAALTQKFIPAGKKGDLGIERDTFDKGFWGWLGTTMPPEPIPNPHLVTGALAYAGSETWRGIRLIGIGFKLLFQGRVSMRSIGGPIMIGQLAGQAGQMGASSFFWIMALISLNLGLINLLPIPVLDGGQIVMVAIESITKRPISRTIKEKVMLVGVAMLLLLMVFATWNDIARIVLG